MVWGRVEIFNWIHHFNRTLLTCSLWFLVLSVCRNLNIHIYFTWWARLIMDYVLKLQGHISMSNLIGMPWLYFMVLAWWFILLSLRACSGAPQLQHFATAKKVQNWMTCAWRGTLFSGQIGTLHSEFEPKISLWSENKEAWSWGKGNSIIQSEFSK